VASFTPRPHYPREKISGTRWIGGWVDRRVALEAGIERKIPSPLPKPVVKLITKVADNNRKGAEEWI